MKLNVSYPPTGAQKTIEVDDDLKLRAFYDKRISQEVDGKVLGDEFKGYIFKISGGNDKQGFPMKQGVLVNTRVKVLMSEGASCFRIRRKGERKRKSVRGCIVGPDLAVLALIIVKKGEEEIPGLTDKYIPRRLGPKRASKIRKLFNLSKEDDVRKYVVRREIQPKEGKTFKKKVTKAPKIQRLITPIVLQRRRRIVSLKKHRAVKSKQEAAEYAQLLAQRNKDLKERREQTISARRASSSKKDEPTPVKKVEPAKKTVAAPKKAAEAPKKIAEPVKKTEVKKTEVKKTQAPAKKAAEAPAKKAAEAPAAKKAPATKKTDGGKKQ